MSQVKLSAVISTHNSETLIEDCLKSAEKVADEIIIVDNESTDKTVKIAKRYTKIIHPHKNNPLVLNQAKNYGFTKAKGEWIISLDPDERISPKLATEIKKILKEHSSKRQHPAYQMPRKNIIFGRWIKHGLWYPDEQIRLFRRGQARFLEKHNHEKLKVKGRIGSLKGHLIHYNYTGVTQYIDKINHLYSDNEAKTAIESGKIVKWYDAIRMPLSDFLANFFAREAYKDGLHGLVLSLMQAFYTFVVFAKIWEQQGFKKYQSDQFLTEAKTEFMSKMQEFNYWYQQKQGLTSSPPKRFIPMLRQFFSK